MLKSGCWAKPSRGPTIPPIERRSHGRSDASGARAQFRSCSSWCKLRSPRCATRRPSRWRGLRTSPGPERRSLSPGAPVRRGPARLGIRTDQFQPHALPQVPDCDRAIGTPALAEISQLAGLRRMLEAVDAMDRVAHAEIVDRENVRAPEVEHQEHL